MLVILSRFAVWDCFRRRFWTSVNHLNGQPVGPRFEQMVRKIQNWLSSSWNRLYYLYKSVPFAAKLPPRPVRNKQGHLFRCSVAPGYSSAGKTQKGVFHFLSNQIFRNLFVNGKQAQSRY